MFNTSSTPFTMPVTPAYGGYGNGMDGFGNGGWWVIILFALIFGWGRNGFGGNDGSNGNYFTDSAVQRGFDNQSVLNKLNGIEQGICNLGYDNLAQISNLGNNVSNGFHGVDNAICNLGYQTQQGFNGVERGFCNLSSQLSNCCCETQRAIDGVNYNLATQSCDTRNTIQNTTRDIIDNNNANTRSILDFLVQDKISSLQAENQSLKFAASQSEQNAFIAANQNAQTAELIRRLGADCPTPAYVVQPPQPVTFPVNGCGNFRGFSDGFGCGCDRGCGC